MTRSEFNIIKKNSYIEHIYEYSYIFLFPKHINIFLLYLMFLEFKEAFTFKS